MKNSFKVILAGLIMLNVLNACEGNQVVDSGTYQGEIKEVKAGKSEIFVETADNKILELYFTETTFLTRGESPAEFSDLKEGQKVEVSVEKVGNRLDPVSVKIME